MWGCTFYLTSSTILCLFQCMEQENVTSSRLPEDRTMAKCDQNLSWSTSLLARLHQQQKNGLFCDARLLGADGVAIAVHSLHPGCQSVLTSMPLLPVCSHLCMTSGRIQHGRYYSALWSLFTLGRCWLRTATWKKYWRPSWNLALTPKRLWRCVLQTRNLVQCLHQRALDKSDSFHLPDPLQIRIVNDRLSKCEDTPLGDRTLVPELISELVEPSLDLQTSRSRNTSKRKSKSKTDSPNLYRQRRDKQEIVIKSTEGTNSHHVVGKMKSQQQKSETASPSHYSNDSVGCSATELKDESESFPTSSKKRKRGRYRCKLCGKTFRDRSTHERTHSNERPFLCDVCGKSFKGQGALVSHLHIHQGAEFPCTVCGKPYTCLQYMKIHMKTHDPANRCVCEQCGHVCYSQEELYRHGRAHEVAKYECSICGSYHKTISRLNQHKKKHTESHPCSVCGKIFNSKTSLRCHEDIHQDARPFQCSYCASAFRTQYQLSVHERNHTGAMPFKCRPCQMSFVRYYSLSYHLKHKHGITGKFSELSCVVDNEFVGTGAAAEENAV